MPPKRILVALDTTPLATDVLHAALEVAGPADTKIRAVRALAVPSPCVPIPGALPPLPTLDLEALADAARSTLLAAMREVPAEQRDGIIVGFGTPSEVIEREADEYQPDLIVLGAHHHGALRRMLGTTAARVVEHAHRSVLVVRPRPSDVAAG